MTIVVRLCLLSMLGFGGAGVAAAQTLDMAVYKYGEGILKTEYDRELPHWRQTYEQHAAEFKTQQAAHPQQKIPGNWADRIEDADDWVKMFYYNQANMLVSCAAAANIGAPEIAKGVSEPFQKSFKPCFGRNVQFMVMFFHVDNTLVTSSPDKFSSVCEPKARRQDHERALEPYGFLQPKVKASLRLMDFGAYNKCIFGALGTDPRSMGLDPRLLFN